MHYGSATKTEDYRRYEEQGLSVPEAQSVHYDPSRALGDLIGIKKHYSRKHGKKK